MKAAYESVRNPREKYDLERKSQHGGNIQVMLARALREEECRRQKQHPLHREEVHKVNDATLRQHTEGQQQQKRRTEIQQLQIEGRPDHTIRLPAPADHKVSGTVLSI